MSADFETDRSAADSGSVLIGGEYRVGRIGLGTNQLGNDPGSRAILRHAISRGVGLIDTADIYNSNASESVIGETLGRSGEAAGAPNAPAARPDDRLIATKGGYNGAGASDLSAAIDASLARLQTDSIDLYYLHRPDPDVPFQESVAALAQAQAAGKIKHIGLSNVSIDQIAQAQAILPIAAVQNEYNLSDRSNDEVIDLCSERQIVFVAYYPLRGAESAAAIAESRGASMQQVALAWILKRSPIVVPIPGTRSPEHLDQNLAAIDLRLSDDEIAQLDAIAAGDDDFVLPTAGGTPPSAHRNPWAKSERD